MFFKKKKQLKHFLIAAIIRIPLFFIQLGTWEYEAIIATFDLYLESGDLLLYEAFRQVVPSTLFPPLFYYSCFLIYLFIGNLPFYYFSFKILWLIFDFLNIIIIMKIADIYFISENKKEIYINSYILCPFIFLLTALRGLNEVITLFFILASIYFFLKEKTILSYFFMSLGFMHSIIPIILIIPYFLYLVNKTGGFKKWLISFPIIFIVVLISSLPYIILIPDIFLRDFILMFTRSEYSMSFAEIFIPTLFNLTLFEVNLFGIALEVSFSVIYILILIGAFFILFYFKFKINTKEDLIICIACMFLLIPLISRSFHLRQLFWLYPIISLVIYKRESYSEVFFMNYRKKKNVFIISIALANVILIGSLIGLSIAINNQILPREIFNYVLFIYLIIWCIFLLSLNLVYSFLFNICLLIYSTYLILLFNASFAINYGSIINLVYLIFYCLMMIYYIKFSLSKDISL